MSAHAYTTHLPLLVGLISWQVIYNPGIIQCTSCMTLDFFSLSFFTRYASHDNLCDFQNIHFTIVATNSVHIWLSISPKQLCYWEIDIGVTLTLTMTMTSSLTLTLMYFTGIAWLDWHHPARLAFTLTSWGLNTIPTISTVLQLCPVVLLETWKLTFYLCTF